MKNTPEGGQLSARSHPLAKVGREGWAAQVRNPRDWLEGGTPPLAFELHNPAK